MFRILVALLSLATFASEAITITNIHPNKESQRKSLRYEGYFPTEEAARVACTSYVSEWKGQPWSCNRSWSNSDSFYGRQFVAGWIRISYWEFRFIVARVRSCEAGLVVNEDTGICEPERNICETTGEDEWLFDENTLYRSKNPEKIKQCAIAQAQFHRCTTDAAKGNPISCATGVKTQTEVLYNGHGAAPLSVSLSYRSHDFEDKVGGYWLTNKGASLALEPAVKAFAITLPNGSKFYFPDREGETNLSSASPEMGTLVRQADGGLLWKYRDNTMLFVDGKVQETRDQRGHITRYAYSGSNLSTVTNHFGQSIAYFYDTQSRLTAIQTPDGNRYTMTYNDDDLIETIIYPDNTPDVIDDNPRKRFHYENTLLVQIDDETGEAFARWTYDNENRAISSEHGNGLEKVSLSFNDNTTEIQEWVDTDKTRTQLATIETILGANRVTRLETIACDDCQAQTETKQYDPITGNLIESINAQGIKTVNKWDDERGLIVEKTDGVGTVNEQNTRIVWHETLRRPIQIISDNSAVYYDYNDKGLLVKQRAEDLNTGEVRTTQFSFDSNSLLVAVDGPRNDVEDITRYTYTEQGFIKSITNALGHKTEVLAHSIDGKVTQFTDPNGLTTTMGYNPRGNISYLDVGGRKTEFIYDLAERLRSTISPDGQTLQYFYDAGHRLIAIEDAAGNRISYTRDLAGNVKASSIYDPAGALAFRHESVFNGLNQLRETLGNHGQVTRYEYDELGNAVDNLDGLGNSHSSTFDALNRLTQSIDPISGKTQMQYDQDGQITRIVDANARQTSYQYNGFGETIKVISPDTGTTSYRYDPAGNVISIVDARGIEIKYTYDPLNRLTRIDYPNDAPKTFVYDQTYFGIGLLTSVVDGNVSVTKYSYTAYSELARVQTQIDDTYYVQRMTYTESGQLASQSLVKAFSISEADKVPFYNPALLDTSEVDTALAQLNAAVTAEQRKIAQRALNRAQRKAERKLALNDRRAERKALRQAIADARKERTFNTLRFEYNNLGQVAEVSLDDAVLANDIAYLPFGPQTSVTLGNGVTLTNGFDTDFRLTQRSDSLVQNNTYAYSTRNNIVEIVNSMNARTSRYDYDALGRITQAQSGLDATQLSFDAIGQRTAVFNKNESTPQWSPVSLPVLEKDAHGNILNDGKNSYTYNEAGRLKTSVNAQGLQTSYFYNANEQRVKKINENETVHYVYDPVGLLVGEFTTQNTGGANANENANNKFSSSVEYVYLNGKRLAIIKNDKIYYTHTNHLDAPVALSDTDQNIVWQAQYDAFGKVQVLVDDIDGFNARLPGQYLDVETGLYYNWHRYYDPTQGRYLTSDPLGMVDGPNTYAYVGNNPVNYVDPTGLISVAACANPINAATCAAAGLIPAMVSGASTGALVAAGMNVAEQLSKDCADFSWGELGSEVLFGAATGAVPMGIFSGVTSGVFNGLAKKFAGALGKGKKVTKSVDPGTLARTHSIEGKRSSKLVDGIADSMRKDGFVGDPIDVVQHKGKNYIIDGHHRAAAARRTGTKVNINVVDDVANHRSSFNSVDDVINSADMVGPDRLRAPRR